MSPLSSGNRAIVRVKPLKVYFEPPVPVLISNFMASEQPIQVRKQDIIQADNYGVYSPRTSQNQASPRILRKKSITPVNTTRRIPPPGPSRSTLGTNPL